MVLDCGLAFFKDTACYAKYENLVTMNDLN